jgi:hypothetical protein
MERRSLLRSGSLAERDQCSGKDDHAYNDHDESYRLPSDSGVTGNHSDSEMPNGGPGLAHKSGPRPSTSGGQGCSPWSGPGLRFEVRRHAALLLTADRSQLSRQLAH